MNVDTIAAYSGGPADQAYWLGRLNVGSRPAPFCLHQIIRMKSGTGCACLVESTISIVLSGITLLYHQLFSLTNLTFSCMSHYLRMMNKDYYYLHRCTKCRLSVRMDSTHISGASADSSMLKTTFIITTHHRRRLFTARCTCVHSVVLPSYVVRPSVSPSVCNVGDLRYVCRACVRRVSWTTYQ